MEQASKTGLTTGKKWRKNISSSSRWLHIYLSLFSFVALLFFAVTGVTLNHTDWFSDMQHTNSINDSVNVGYVNGKDTSSVNKLAIVEEFRGKHHVKGSLAEFRIDDSQCMVSFKGPGYAADIFLDRENGKYELSETVTGWVGVMNDLHKGRDSGKTWAWLIDISAILMILVSLTGLVMLFFLKKKRVNGVIVMVVGGLVVYLVYLFFV